MTAREVLNHKWMRQAGGASALLGSQTLSVGLVGAVVDPACRQLVRRMEAEYGIPQREVIDALRRGERSPLTATYWLLRQQEIRKGRFSDLWRTCRVLRRRGRVRSGDGLCRRTFAPQQPSCLRCLPRRRRR